VNPCTGIGICAGPPILPLTLTVTKKTTVNPPAPTNASNFSGNPTDQKVPVSTLNGSGQNTGSNTGNNANTPTNPPTNKGGIGAVMLSIINNLITNSINGVRINTGSTAIGQTITSVPSTPTTVVSGGQTLVLSSGHITTGSTTVPLFAPGSNSPTPIAAGNIPAKPTSFVVNGVSISVGDSSVVIGGQSIPSIHPPGSTTVVVNGQTFTLSSGNIIGPSTTVTIFGSGSQGGSLTATTTGDITLSLGPSIAVIPGKAYTIGPSAIPTTTVVNGQTISIGPGGVGFATKPIPPSLFTGGADASRGLAKSGGLSALFLVLVGLL
jgi:hypothetical protein